jgi:hypothetical protein
MNINYAEYYPRKQDDEVPFFLVLSGIERFSATKLFPANIRSLAGVNWGLVTPS